MPLSGADRQEILGEYPGRDLVRLFDAVADRLAPDAAEANREAFLSLLGGLIGTGRLQVRLDGKGGGDAASPTSRDDVLRHLRSSWPALRNDRAYRTEVLIFLETSGQIWWSDWGTPNAAFLEA